MDPCTKTFAFKMTTVNVFVIVSKEVKSCFSASLVQAQMFIVMFKKSDISSVI